MGRRWSRKYKDGMNWICTFSLIPVIELLETVLGVLWLVEVCRIRRQVRISVVDLPFFSYSQRCFFCIVFQENNSQIYLRIH